MENFKKFKAHISFMRLILTFLILLIVNSCKTVPDSSKSSSKLQTIANCPEDGICNIEVLKNTQLILKTDEFGSLYPHLEEGNHIVLKFEFIRNEIPDTSDSGYREEIYLQLNPEAMEVELQNKSLSDVNLLFGRLCFCRGQTGYYRIKTGYLSIKKVQNNSYQLNLEFKSEEVPQVIHHLNEIVQI